MRPMLAATVKDLNQLRYPLLVSPKLDGIRALIVNGKVLSRTLKPIPNKCIQAALGVEYLNGFDGELILGDPTAKDCYRKTNSAVMSVEGQPEITYYAFDFVDTSANYSGRFYHHVLGQMIPFPSTKFNIGLKYVRSKLAKTAGAVEKIEREFLELGYEGVMLRDPNGVYKFGRSTLHEQYLMKLKRFDDSEAEVLYCVPLKKNNNPKTTDKLGLSVRSSHKANKVNQEKLGAFMVQDIHTGQKFEIGTGFTDAQRIEFFTDSSIGKIVKYKFFNVGIKTAPRHPVFLGWRDKIDL